MSLDNSRFNEICEQFDQLKTYRDHLQLSIEKDSTRIGTLKSDYENAIKARAIIQKVSEETQKKIETQIGDLVTLALSAVFDDPYQFVLEFKTARNKTECNVWFEREGERVKPFDAAGGGTIDIASIASRVAFWSIQRTAPIFFLDEPAKFVSHNYQPLVAEMIQMLSDQLDLQIIMTTHIKELASIADSIVEL